MPIVRLVGTTKSHLTRNLQGFGMERVDGESAV